MTQIRIIVIDPNTRTVEERHVEKTSDSCADQIRQIIGGHFCFACQIPTPNGVDVCYVDDDGLHKYDRYFVLLGWGHQPFAGIGVIVGSNEIGATMPATVAMDEVLRRIAWGDEILVMTPGD